VQVPFLRVDTLALPLVRAGADALTLTAPPRAVMPLAGPDQSNTFLRGRLYGAALLPLLLHILTRWTAKLGVPIVACGGIASGPDAVACLALGATAVQVDALLWRDPGLAHRIVAAWNESVMLTGNPTPQ